MNIVYALACIVPLALGAFVLYSLMAIAASSDKHIEILEERRRQQAEADYLQTAHDNATPANQIP